jgi:septum formation inhibitor MinC
MRPTTSKYVQTVKDAKRKLLWIKKNQERELEWQKRESGKRKKDQKKGGAVNIREMVT